MKRQTKMFLLGSVVLALAGCGDETGADRRAALVDIAQAAARQSDRVSVEELAEWLIADRKDFLLIDVRSTNDFEKGQIGDAQNVPLAKLVTVDSLQRLPTDRRIVVYSNGSENAAKAAVMLRLEGFDAHLVAGGYNAWQQRILNPDISAQALDGESLQVAAQRAYSCYFVGDREGGAARSGDDEPFVPPVFELDEEEDGQPLPPPGEESC